MREFLDTQAARQQDDAYFLKLFGDYEYEDSPIEFQYIYDAPELSVIKDIYKLNQLVDNKEEIKQQIALMKWVKSTLIPDGTCIPSPPIDALSIIERTKISSIKSNCWMHATVLNEVYLSFGFRSKMARCMPMDLRYDDCHCIVHVYSTQYGKWIIMDAAYAGYYFDAQGIPMGLPDLRKALINKERIYIPGATRESQRHILNYWTKNIIRFQCYQKSCYGAESTNQDELVMINLNPRLFKLSNTSSEISGRIVKQIHISNPDVFWK